MRKVTLYKYARINKNLINSLIHSQIWFSSPEQLNDPFDCQIDLETSVSNAIKKAKGVKRDVLVELKENYQFFEEIRKLIASYGVFSAAKSHEISSLWSHYSDEHKGVCLVYTIPEDFINDDDNDIVGGALVSYGLDPITNWFVGNAASAPISSIDWLDESVEEDDVDLLEVLVRVLLTSKDPSWGYEEEYRIVRRMSGPLKIQNEFLDDILFGLNATDTDIELVKSIAQKSGFKGGFYKMHRSEHDFGLVGRRI